MIPEKIQDLCNAIIEQAVKDYRRALAGEYVEHKSPKYVIAECERFFRSTWYSILTKVDGEHLITEIRKEFIHKRLKEDLTMEVKRKISVDTDMFELGDIISFKLTTGEKVKAKAIHETPNGMLFITVDCLKDEQKMFENPGRAKKVDYEHSDLRKKLNGEIFESFPEEIKGHMVGMRVGQTNCFDMLRIPTEREIFGKNHYGVEEPVSVRRFYGMENRRERIASQGSETSIGDLYWLQNKVEDSVSHFTLVDNNGLADYDFASYSFGVRPVFLLS